MPTLADVPLEVLIDNLLPLIPLKDVLSLTVTSKDLAALCADDTFWKRKLKEDYNFSDNSSARTKGYKFLYKGVHNAKLYVWGSAGEGRLGLGTIYGQRGILTGSRPYPTQLKVPGPRIVELAAGGWSFHALDSQGDVHVWGQLDGNLGFHMDPFSSPNKRADSPTKLVLPERIAKIGAGRAHATALSSSNRVWVFTSWGRPCVLTTPLISTSNKFTTPCQVECGWDFSAVLTHGGEVLVWWPFEDEFGRLNTINHDTNSTADVRVEDDVVHCQPWEVSLEPKQIREEEASLPKLKDEEKDVGTKIVKIAAGDNFLIGLTEGGHVLKADLLNGSASFNHPLQRPRWKYLERFSDVNLIRNHPTFNVESSSEGRAQFGAPETLHITHISAHFLTFFAYSTGSSSIVLKGSQATQPDTQPDITPSLQNRGVISVVLGDYHFGALTSTGKLLTWGAYGSGALGLGDPTQLPVGSPGGYRDENSRTRAQRSRVIPPDVAEPTEVKFGTRDGGKGRESFVFGATASGWHTGALVIDLEGTEEETEEEAEEGGLGTHDDVSLPGQPWPGHMPFRIGLAGARGRRIGGRALRGGSE